VHLDAIRRLLQTIEHVTEGQVPLSSKTLSRVLREKREAKGFSQRALVKVAQVECTYLVKLESGDKKNPSLEILKHLAGALGVSVTERYPARSRPKSSISPRIRRPVRARHPERPTLP
jgi:transcriptional regulator with XRE-family HTH domain